MNSAKNNSFNITKQFQKSGHLFVALRFSVFELRSALDKADFEKGLQE